MLKAYKLNVGYYALDKQQSRLLGKEVKKFFPKDSVVVGKMYLGEGGVKSEYLLLLNKYLIPLDYLTESKESATMSNSMSAFDNMQIIAENASEFSDKEQADKNVFNSTYLNNKIKSNNGYRYGFISGAVIGLIVALYYRKNIWLFAGGGGIAGGYIGYKIIENQVRSKINYKESEKDE